MDTKPVYITPDGFAKLKAELDELLNVRRPALAARLHDAIQQGDLSENADYITAKEEQGFMEGRILELEAAVRNVVLIEENTARDGRIRLGCHVTVREDGFDDPETYHVVGSTEANPAAGKISHESPLGSALMGHKVGDEVMVSAPAGKITFRILKVA